MKYEIIINGEKREPISFNVRQVASGATGGFTANVPYSFNINLGDVFNVSIDGEPLLAGTVKKIKRKRSSGIKSLTCYGYTQLLVNKYCVDSGFQVYEDEDAGAVAKSLVDHYFSGTLTSTNIDETIGVTIDHIDITDKTVYVALKELANRANCEFYVDDAKDVHFFIVGSRVAKQYIEENDIIDIEVSEDDTAKKDLIRVKGSTGNATAGIGDLEYLHIDPAITTDTEAQNIADRLLSYLNLGKVTINVEVHGFYNVHRSEQIRINSPPDNVYNQFLIIQSIMWRFSNRNVSTVLKLGAAGFLGSLTVKSSAGTAVREVDLTDLFASNFQQTQDALDTTTQIVSEGNYSTYTLKWESLPMTKVGLIWEHSFFTADEVIALIHDNKDLAVVTVSDGTKTEYDDITQSIDPQWEHHSIYGKYWVTIQGNQRLMYIYKDGVLLQTISVEDIINDEWEGVMISQSGKYIISIHDDVGEFTLKCYEGS